MLQLTAHGGGADAGAVAACKHRQLLRRSAESWPEPAATLRAQRDCPTRALRCLATARAPPRHGYLGISKSAQNIMCGDTNSVAVRQGDTGGSAKRQSRLGRDTSVRGGAVCAPRAGRRRAPAAAESRDAATPKPSKRYGGQRPPSR